MTAKERAEETLPKLYGNNGMYRGPLNAKAQIEAAITTAVLEERIRCATFVLGDGERDDYPVCMDVRDIADGLLKGE